MRNLFLSFVIFSVILHLSPFSLHAQTHSVTYEKNPIWVSFNYIGAFNQIDNKTLNGSAFGIDVNFSKGIHLLALHTNFTSTEHVSGPNPGEVFIGSLVAGIFGGTYNAPPRKYTRSKMTDIGFMYGVITKPTATRLFASVGISTIFGSSNIKDDHFGLGVPLKVGVIFSLKNLGIGLNLVANFNGFSNYQGFGLTFQIGEMRPY